MAATGLAALGLTARSLVGHLSASIVGGFAVAVHVLAAAVWCGTLAALVLTVERRGQWARVLPRFSSVSLRCVVVLLVGGVAGAVVTLPSPAALYATGYGRVLAAKVVVTGALTGARLAQSGALAARGPRRIAPPRTCRTCGRGSNSRSWPSR